MAVKVTMRKYTSGDKEGQQVVGVESPYSADFVAGARRLNGVYNRTGNYWLFSPLVIDKVYDLCMRVYGEDGRETVKPADLVTLKVTTPTSWDQAKGSIELGGRVIARAWGRDSGAKLGEDVVLIEGRARSSGSVKNWYTTLNPGSIVEILNMPRRKAEQLVAEGYSDLALEIVEQGALPVPIAADLESAEGCRPVPDLNRRAVVCNEIDDLMQRLESLRDELIEIDKGI
jgi:hypothetical protein